MKLKQSILDDFDSLNLRQGKYLLAFSAGPDSVYLLWQLKEYYRDELNQHISLVYINYHDSPYVDEEERIVYYYRDLFQLELFKNDTKFNEIGNFEEWAREYRYHLFRDICQKQNFTALLTAHQKTDVVETYLLQKERNNLPTFYGLRKKNDLYHLILYRPMLSISKTELTKELDKEKLPYYDDITNKNLKKKRNLIRTQLNDEDLLNQYQKEIDIKNQEIRQLEDFFRQHPDGMDYSTYQMPSDYQQRYCFFLLDHHRIGKNREGLGKRLFDFLKNKSVGILKLNNNQSIYRNKDFFFISATMDHLEYSFTFTQPGIYSNPFFEIDLSNPSQFNLPALPVLVRNYHSGDRLGTDLPEKDVKTFLRKQGVPSYLIPLYPVFVYQKKIQCVPFYQDILKEKIPLRLKFLKGIQYQSVLDSAISKI